MNAVLLKRSTSEITDNKTDNGLMNMIDGQNVILGCEMILKNERLGNVHMTLLLGIVKKNRVKSVVLPIPNCIMFDTIGRSMFAGFVSRATV
jgi:hypothetical protein